MISGGDDAESSEHCLNGALESKWLASADVTGRKVVRGSIALSLITGGSASDLGSEMSDEVVSGQGRRWFEQTSQLAPERLAAAVIRFDSSRPVSDEPDLEQLTQLIECDRQSTSAGTERVALKAFSSFHVRA